MEKGETFPAPHAGVKTLEVQYFLKGSHPLTVIYLE
jgi:hypothetical protein